MQRIRPAVKILADNIGIEHALATRRLYTDGAEVLYAYAYSHEDESLLELTVVRTGQRQFSKLVREYLQRMTYADDGWATQLRLPASQRAEVVVNRREPSASRWSSTVGREWKTCRSVRRERQPRGHRRRLRRPCRGSRGRDPRCCARAAA